MNKRITMSMDAQIITLYSELAEDPMQDFGWEKGRANAKAHGYEDVWFEQLPEVIWDYCAAVGNPFRQGEIKPGDTVLDLGCGAGVDLLISALQTGDKGRAIGIDITPKMVAKAQEHARMAGLDNVEVMESDLSSIRLDDGSVDVVISNGAINLSESKEAVFAEIYRLLKPEGRLLFADMIDSTEPALLSFCSIEKPASSCCSSEPAPSPVESGCSSSDESEWANCVAGTLKKEELIEIMRVAGFGEIECMGATHYKTSESTIGATFRAIKIAPELHRKLHWEQVFETKDYRKVLWHQESPALSVRLIESVGTLPDEAIIDVGCGASLLVDALIWKGQKNVTLLDVAEAPLQIVKERLDVSSGSVKYLCADVTQAELKENYSIWHDRALFHFLLRPRERESYMRKVYSSLVPGGTAIIGTFAVNGPTTCSDLDIVQYDSKRMEKELVPGLELIRSHKVMHLTPQKSEQAYNYFMIRKG